MEPEIEVEHHANPTNKRIGILIAIMATVLAFTEMAARNADTDIVRESVEASDIWAFFQAKSIRAAMLRADARALQVETAGRAETDSGQVAKTVADWEAAAAHEDSEPTTGEGRKELAAKAQGIEKHRDERAAAKETYEFASGALELGILLASSAIVTALIPLAFIGAAFGVVGTVLGVLGHFAPHAIGG
ncbi:MAG TPA: DUF4337 domain-containing protein [Micropepsaceae bacterium]|jgi:hypothetical protein